MKTIYKYELKINGISLNDIHKDATLLDVEIQDGKVCGWFLVDTEKEVEPRMFIIQGTGQEIMVELQNNIKFVKTLHDEPFVWHVFEIVKDGEI